MRFFALSLLLALTANAATITGEVVSVADGDTITVLDGDKVQHKVRLAGIDAPEKMQPYGRKSKFSLSDLIYLKHVEVLTDKTDHYGRRVGKVLVNGKDVNLIQIERGMAWWYRAYQAEQSENDRLIYEAAEASAKVRKVGLWADAKALPPWVNVRAAGTRTSHLASPH